MTSSTPDHILEQGLAPLADDRVAPHPCVSCCAPAGTAYCPHCGEQDPAARRYRLRDFAAEAAEAVTNADGRLWRTFATLVRRPGELTRAYMIGRRTPFMRPLQLFLVVNVAYFLWASFTGERVFDTPLRVHFANTNYGERAHALVHARIAERGITEDTYRAVFDSAATVQARSLIIVMVPMFALVLAGVEWRRGRPALQHLVFALHVYTMLLVLAIVQRWILVWPVAASARLQGRPFPAQLMDAVVTWFIVGGLAVWIIAGLRRAYGDRPASAIAKGAVLTVTLFVALLAYRVLLFYTVFYTT